MNDFISRLDAVDALETVGYDFSDSELSAIELEEVCEAVGDVRQDMINRIKRLPSAQPDNRIAKIADLVEGTIDHYDLDDAMDLIYQIKEILGNETSNI